MDTSHSGRKRKSYDLRLRAGERRLVWNNPDPDHGLTLTDHDIAWIAGRRQTQASLRDIVEVHLQIGYIRNDAIASCRLRIADGSTVLISSESSGGLEDAALAGRTPSVLAISADCVPVSSQATAAPKAAPASAAAVRDATHPQICHCTSGIGRVALRHPGEVVPALAGAKKR